MAPWLTISINMSWFTIIRKCTCVFMSCSTDKTTGQERKHVDFSCMHACVRALCMWVDVIGRLYIKYQYRRGEERRIITCAC